MFYLNILIFFFSRFHVSSLNQDRSMGGVTILLGINLWQLVRMFFVEDECLTVNVFFFSCGLLKRDSGTGVFL